METKRDFVCKTCKFWTHRVCENMVVKVPSPGGGNSLTNVMTRENFACYAWQKSDLDATDSGTDTVSGSVSYPDGTFACAAWNKSDLDLQSSVREDPAPQAADARKPKVVLQLELGEGVLALFQPCGITIPGGAYMHAKILDIDPGWEVVSTNGLVSYDVGTSAIPAGSTIIVREKEPARLMSVSDGYEVLLNGMLIKPGDPIKASDTLSIRRKGQQ